MRPLRLAALVIVAACGSPNRPTTGKDEAPPRIGYAEHLDQLDDLVERGCGCADRRCIAKIDRELADLVMHVQFEVVPEDDAVATRMEKGSEQLERLSVCMTDRQVPTPALGAAMLARMGEAAAGVCDCRDMACASRYTEPLLPELVASEFFPIGYEELEALRSRWKKMRSCLETLSVPVTELGALRDQACACEDVACAEAARGAFEAFLDKHADTRSSEVEADAVGRIAGELGECLNAQGAPWQPATP